MIGLLVRALDFLAATALLGLEEQNEVLRTGKSPGVSIGPATVRLQRMGEKGLGYSSGSPESDEAAA